MEPDGTSLRFTFSAYYRLTPRLHPSPSTTIPASSPSPPSPPSPLPPSPVAPSPTPPRGGGGWGDVHLTTFDGLHYDFQAAGEFLLAKSTVSGESFQVQIRLAPYDFGGSVPASKVSVSVTTQIAAKVGTDRVTFGIGRQNVVQVNGNATALSMSNPVLNLSGGQLIELSPSTYQLVWNTGERITVTDAGSYFNYTVSLPKNAAPGSVVGLLGSLSGAANDFQLADGTVLQQPISSTQLYGQFADAWRIPAGTQGLFDYSPGESTDDFAIAGFPTTRLTLSDFPATLVKQALAMAAAAGITDAVLAQDAALDYLVSGNPAFFNTDANVSAGVSTNVVSSAQITSSPSTVPLVGAAALSTSVVEAISGPTVVDFGAYLTNPASAPIVVDFSVIANPGDIGASAFPAAPCRPAASPSRLAQRPHSSRSIYRMVLSERCRPVHWKCSSAIRAALTAFN